MSIDVDIDLEGIERELMEVFSRRCGLGEIGASTPMAEIRARAEIAGLMAGRAVGAISHEGPITADIAMRIRSFEEDYKQRFLESASEAAGPGGALREYWERKNTE